MNIIDRAYSFENCDDCRERCVPKTQDCLQLPCNHIFHTVCLTRKTTGKCTVCNRKFKHIDPAALNSFTFKDDVSVELKSKYALWIGVLMTIVAVKELLGFHPNSSVASSECELLVILSLAIGSIAIKILTDSPAKKKYLQDKAIPLTQPITMFTCHGDSREKDYVEYLNTRKDVP